MANSVKKHDAAIVRQAVREYQDSQAASWDAVIVAAADAVVKEMLARARRGGLKDGNTILKSGVLLNIRPEIFGSSSLVSELKDRGFIVKRTPSGGLAIFI